MVGARAVIAAVAMVSACARSHLGPGFDCGDDPCDDGDACNGAEVCDPDRGCLPGSPVACRDDDPCTVDACAAGRCAHTPRDLDGDGHADLCAGGDDCAPLDPTAHPGAQELCNDRDDDCDLEVDEGLPFGLVSEAPLPEGIYDPAFLDDGSLAGVRFGPVDTAPAPIEAYVHGSGETRTQPLEQAAWGLEVRWGLLSAGARAIAALIGPPQVDDLLGFRWHTAQWVRVVEIQPGRDPLVRDLALYQPEDEEATLAADLQVGWIDDLPVVAWTDGRWGMRRVLVAPVDGASDPDVVAQGLAVGEVRVAGDPVGATVFWGQDGTVHAARLDASGHPTGATTALVGVPYGGFDACALPSGTALAISSGPDDRPQVDVYVLGRDLVLPAEPLAELPEPRSEHGLHVQARCLGSSVLVLNAVAVDDQPDHREWHLRRVTAEGDVDFEDRFLAPWADFAAAPRPTLTVGGQDAWALVYGCGP